MNNRAALWLFARQISIKNQTAPEGKHWDIGTQSYQDNPECDTGYHFDLDTYKCIPD